MLITNHLLSFPNAAFEFFPPLSRIHTFISNFCFNYFNSVQLDIARLGAQPDGGFVKKMEELGISIESFHASAQRIKNELNKVSKISSRFLSLLPIHLSVNQLGTLHFLLRSSFSLLAYPQPKYCCNYSIPSQVEYHQSLMRAHEARDRAIMGANLDRVTLWSIIHTVVLIGVALIQVTYFNMSIIDV